MGLYYFLTKHLYVSTHLLTIMKFDLKNTETKILYATVKLLEEEGSAGTTTRKIASRANVSEVTLFRKFKNKDNLLNEAKMFYSDYFLEKLDNISKINENKPLKEALLTIWWECKDILENDINLIKVSIEEVRGKSIKEGALPKISKKIISNISKLFQEQIDKGNIRNINPDMAAFTVFSVIFESIVLGKIYGYNLNQDEDKSVEDFLDIFLNGISSENS